MEQRQNKTDEIKFFNIFAKRSEYDVFTRNGYEKLLNLFSNLVRPRKGERLVDLGCGTGAFTKQLRRYELDLTGIDISEECINLAGKSGPGIEFLAGDMERTNFKNESFDIVVFSGVLHHFTDFTKAVQEACRILKKGGRCFAYEPNKRNPLMWLYRDERSPIRSKAGKTPNERLLTSEEINRIFKAQGFSVIVEATSGITFRYVEGKMARILMPVYNLFEKWFDKTCLARKYGSFLVLCGVKK